MTENEPKLVVIDTDGGGDDAAAILLALANKKLVKVLAITCCFGNTDLNNALANVLRILTVCKEYKIPVYRGCNGPLIKGGATGDHLVFGTDGFSNVGNEFSTGGLHESEQPASVALIQLAEKHPNKIDLLTIGPLTNVAIAHRLDPQFTKNLKSIICMGGNYKGVGNVTETAEFNFYCDPESANMVLREACCPIIMIPWETVYEFGITWDIYDKLIQTETSRGIFVRRINEYYVERSKKKGNRRYYDADFLAAAALLYPECVKESMEKTAIVECNGTHTRGQTLLLRMATDKKVKIITAFDEDILNNLRFQMLQD